MIRGSCFCGFIRYEAEGKLSHETNCHCSVCRRTSGAPFVAWFTVLTADFRLISGEPTNFQSSQHGTRSFCPRCGTQLTFASTQCSDEIDVTICSLENPALHPPKDNTRMSSRLSWVELADKLPSYPEGRT